MADTSLTYRVTLSAAAGPGPSAESGPVGAGDPRRITGMILAYDQDLHPSGPWQTVRFAPGSLERPAELGRVKLLLQHEEHAVPIGAMDTLEDDGAAAVHAGFRIGRHVQAQEAADLVGDGMLDGLSVGVDPLEFHFDDQGTAVITAARLREVSLVTIPAVDDARASIAASRKDRSAMTEVPETQTPVAGLSEADVARVAAALAAAQAPPPAPLPPAAAPIAAEAAPQAAEGRLVVASRPEQYPAVRGSDGKYYTAGDYLVAFAAARREGRWEGLRQIQAALADEVSSDVPGLLPQQIVGNILGRLSDRRPVWDSFSSRPMPMIGEKFSRPRITQHVKVDEQKTQKTDIASQKFTLELEDVTKKTFAGGLDISQQAIDWTSPALLNQILMDFAAVYARRTEAYACDFLSKAAADQSVSWDGNASTLAAALATASGKVYGSLGDDADAYPTTVWISPDVWIRIASLTDKSDRPLFPAMGPSNAFGVMTTAQPDQGPNGTGFTWVVGKRLPTGTFIVGDSEYVESYENGRRVLSVVVPSLLGLDVATMGYAAAYAPYPAALCPIKVNVTPPPASK